MGLKFLLDMNFLNKSYVKLMTKMWKKNRKDEPAKINILFLFALWRLPSKSLTSSKVFHS